MTDLYSNLESTVLFAEVLNSLKKIFMYDLNYFCYKQILNNTVFIFMEKNSEKYDFAFSETIPLILSYMQNMSEWYMQNLSK